MNKKEFLQVAKKYDIKICQMQGKAPYIKDWTKINDIEKVTEKDDFGVVFPIELGNLKVIGLDFDLKCERSVDGKPIDNPDAKLKRLIRKELGEMFKDDAIEVSKSGEGFHLLYYFKDKLPNWCNSNKKICKSVNSEANEHLQLEIFIANSTIHINEGIDLGKIKPWNDKIETFVKKYFKFTPEKYTDEHQDYINQDTKNFSKDDKIWDLLTIYHPKLKTFLNSTKQSEWLKYPNVWQLAILFHHFQKWSLFLKRVEFFRPAYMSMYENLNAYFNENQARLYGENERYFNLCSDKLNYEVKRESFIKTYDGNNQVSFEEWKEEFNQVDDYTELTDYPILNEKIMGLRTGYLYTIVGETSHGKSTFALNIAEMISKKQGIVYCSLEMSIRDVEIQLIANFGHKTRVGSEMTYSQKDMKGKKLAELQDYDFEAIFETLTNFNSKRLFTLYAKSHATIDEIIAMTDEYNPSTGYKYIFIDNLNNLTHTNPSMEGRAKIDFFIAQLQKLATERNMGVIVLAHTRKKVTNSKDKSEDKRIITLDDIKETSAVAQDSQFVLSIYTENTEHNGLRTTISILKNRDGERNLSIHYATNFLYSNMSEIPLELQNPPKPQEKGEYIPKKFNDKLKKNWA